MALSLPASPTTLRHLRGLYQEQLAAVGVSAFAVAAYGPFDLDKATAQQQAEHRLAYKAIDCILAATPLEAERVRALLTSSPLLETARYLLNAVWPRMLREQAYSENVIRQVLPINAVAYVPPVPEATTPAPSTAPLLTLTVCPRRKVHLSSALYTALGLQHRQLIELVPPRAHTEGDWYLDIRPVTPLSTLTASLQSCHSPMFVTRYTLSPRLFMNPDAKGGLFSRLTLELSTTTPEVPGYYLLKPNYALSRVAPPVKCPEWVGGVKSFEPPSQ